MDFNRNMPMKMQLENELKYNIHQEILNLVRTLAADETRIEELCKIYDKLIDINNSFLPFA